MYSQPVTNFWKTLPRPIVGLSPMDGVTDAPFRYIMATHGRPDVIFTEFVPVEAITHNAVRVMSDFLYSEVERPVVAQIYGAEPESFYKVTIAVCAMGFDGVDVNMGCPAKSVVNGGCGAGLILDPARAKAILRACQQAVSDWVNGRELGDAGLPPKIVKWVEEFKKKPPPPMGEGWGEEEVQVSSPSSGLRPPSPEGEGNLKRSIIPITVKTRIGYSENTITDWVKHLLEAEPVAISIHGRTLKQMYKGEADWEAIAAAAEIIHQTPTLVLGNGDIKSAADAVQKIRASGVDGVLVGRATYGNPWIFRDVILRARGNGTEESQVQILRPDQVRPQDDKVNVMEVMLDHGRAFEEMRPDIRYAAMRKHFAWYAQWIPALRTRKRELMQINSYSELVALCDNSPLPTGEGQGEGEGEAQVCSPSPQPSPGGGGGI